MKPRHKSLYLLTDFLIFQGVWVAGVVFQSGLFALGLMSLRLLFCIAKPSDYRVCLMLAPVGIVLDYSLMLSGVFQFDGGVFPLWLGAIWITFTLTLANSMSWLSSKPVVLQSLLGALGGMLSYWSGSRMGAVEFGYSLSLTLTVIFLLWAIALPMFYKSLNKYNKAPDSYSSA